LGARSFLRGTQRAVSVKCFSSPISFSNNVLRHDHAYKEVSNPSSDFGDNVDWSIFKKHISVARDERDAGALAAHYFLSGRKAPMKVASGMLSTIRYEATTA
jgi:hypothetical protein